MTHSAASRWRIGLDRELGAVAALQVRLAGMMGEDRPEIEARLVQAEIGAADLVGAGQALKTELTELAGRSPR